MAVNRAGIVDRNFVALLGELPEGARRTDLDAPVRAGTALSAREAVALFESQLESRHLDLAARALKARNECFYTIGSSGHEGNAVVAAATRPDDPAFLHYRSGAFFNQRARQVPGATPIWDVLLGLAASSEEPIAGGRHKVFGSLPLAIPPQTSTIASHLPKAVGMALAIDRRVRLGLAKDDDRLVVCTFGDASANHSTATGAINAAEWHAHQGVACPVLFVCEDNGIGISTPTPQGWIAAAYGNRPNLAYVAGDGLDLPDAWDAAQAAARWVREHRAPCFLHLRTVRLLGHAGSDVEATYRTPEEIAEVEALDPLLRTARLLVEGGWVGAGEVVALYEEVRARVAALGEEAIRRPKLKTAAEVIAPLAPRSPDAVRAEATRPPDPLPRQAFWGANLPDGDKPRHLAVQINRALGDLLVKYPESFIAGEDVGRKGGVYHLTAELQKRAGKERVIDTLLDEQAILGIAIGAAQAGMLPLPEIQYLAYFHNACDQIRGEAGSLQYFSQGQFRNPMVCRVAGYAYQKGFGGHFHNDNSIAALRDIPGLVIASPARGDDAAAMLRTCMAAAKVDGAVCLFLEPIALYMTRDLHEDGDGLWASEYPPPGHHVPVGSGRTYGDGGDLTIVSWANGLWMSLRAARKLEAEGVRCRVLDLRWVQPLPVEDILREAKATGRVLVVDECRRTGGLSEAVYTALIDGGYTGRLARVAGEDVYIPLGGAANLVLVQEEDILNAARALLPLPAQRGEGAPDSPSPRAAGGGCLRFPPSPRAAGGGCLRFPPSPRAAGGGCPEGAGGGCTMKRVLLVCPGRGSYGREQLRSLSRTPSVTAADAFRRALGRPTPTELDTSETYQSRLHVAGENASILTATCSLHDADTLKDVSVCCVVGNSMGWYTALAVAGALPLEDGLRLIETMGQYQAGNVIGGQVLYPLVDEEWRPLPSPELDAALATIPDLHWSIRLGGQAVLGGSNEAVSAALKRLPPRKVGERDAPFQLPLHSAFHTPLMQATSERALRDLADLRWRAPRVPLVDGRGAVFRPRHADPAAIRDYTLGHQVVAPYDFGASVRVAIREYAPDALVLLGPGGNLGGPVAQVLIADAWHGIASKTGFQRAQREAPYVISMARPEQRALVT